MVHVIHNFMLMGKMMRDRNERRYIVDQGNKCMH